MHNPSFWEQSWWQGISGAIGVIGILLTIVTIIIAINQNKKKRLGYSVLYSGPLVDINSELKNELNVFYKNIEIKNISIFEIIIVNNGDIPIKKIDFEEPIELFFPNVKSIFSITITHIEPSNLKVSFKKMNKKILIKPLLLNPDENFTLKIILDSKDTDYEIKSRVEGVRNMENINAITYKNYDKTSTIVGILGGVFVTIDIYDRYFKINELILNVFYVFFSIALLTSMLSSLYFIKNFRRRRTNK